ncbi:hypothetical protein BEL04_08575 [Mucilaginibacter sp. PPCGB 2223]|uniref:DUF6520 family protein n=1 Tax=Mucilaginibacter sp. PPCGB 2223 TaxID=1886027 RepID=UPI000825FFC2|nr:DUF6520 family protein [Mucilaginibacter sp. PPCGB 2223]OCX54303.1 hypothetical protein BEL04_08575 [Mucilaginibacter sp. PPCGB 2223]
MKNLKVKLAALAMVIGLGSAFATVKHVALSDRKWSYDASLDQYTDITGQQKGINYDCDEASSVCTATYPQAQDPNQDDSNPVSVETGVFN